MHRAASMTSRINLVDRTEYIISSPLDIFLPRNLSYVGQQHRLRKNRLYAMDLVNHIEEKQQLKQQQQHQSRRDANAPKDTFVVLDRNGDSHVSLNPLQWSISESKPSAAESCELGRQVVDEKLKYSTMLSINTQLDEHNNGACDAAQCERWDGLAANHSDEKKSLSDALPNLNMCAPNLLSSNATKYTCSSKCMASPIYQENEFSFSTLPMSRRSSSLKARKTPPNTPSLKKEVRFADAFGLDLTSIRTIFNTDSPPSIPPEALTNLQTTESSHQHFDHYNFSRKVKCCIWQPNFAQPGAKFGFFQRVQDHNVCLENAIANYSTVEGTVRVKNIAYQKQVWARYTMNNWNSFDEVSAKYVQGSSNGTTDRFNFTIFLPERDVPFNQTLFLCIRYVAAGQTMWDSNNGQNYGFVYSNKQITHVS